MIDAHLLLFETRDGEDCVYCPQHCSIGFVTYPPFLCRHPWWWPVCNCPSSTRGLSELKTRDSRTLAAPSSFNAQPGQSNRPPTFALLRYTWCTGTTRYLLRRNFSTTFLTTCCATNGTLRFHSTFATRWDVLILGVASWKRGQWKGPRKKRSAVRQGGRGAPCHFRGLIPYFGSSTSSPQYLH